MSINIKKISKENLFKFIGFLCREFEVIAPVKIGGDIFFNQITKYSELTLDYINPVESPKRFFFPQIELMSQMNLEQYNFLKDEKGDSRKKLIFGIRSCDLISISSVDKFFMEKRIDNYYAELRQDTIFLNLLCNDSAPQCFCTAIPGGSLYCEGYDLRLSILEDGYLVETKTEIGEEILNRNQSLFREIEEKDLVVREQNIRNLGEKIRSRHPFSKAIEILKNEGIQPETWEDIAKSCQDCSGCCYVCPICTCYNMIDDIENSHFKRYRYWDSCLFSGFSRMAQAHNPLPMLGERLRYRFMHRLKYFEDRYTSLGCTGCGRCDIACLGDIGTGSVLKQIQNLKIKDQKLK